MIYRMNLCVLLIVMGLFLFNFSACKPAAPEERAAIEIAVQFPAIDQSAEVSGLAWYKDLLIILPQYPDRFPSAHDGKLFALTKAQILTYLEDIKDNREKPSQPPPLVPQAIDLIAAKETLAPVEEYEGFEAIGFWGDRVFLEVEASPGPMLGYLVSGEITAGNDTGMAITISGKAVKVQPQASIPNASYETLLVSKDHVIIIYEGNGKNVNPNPQAYVYNHDLEFLHAVPFPTIEYRITDSTALDAGNRFWCINYFWPGKKDKEGYKPGPDALAAAYGQGKTHRVSELVERLVEFQYTNQGITLVKTPPIQLQLEDLNKDGRIDKGDSRNWEGIVRLESDKYNGFLLVTDEYPRTMLSFINTNGGH